MSKYTIISLVIMCLLQSGCSLAPAAANRSQKAFDSGEYKESLRLTNRALTTYEYSVEGEANLWILKVDNYIQLKQYSQAYATLRYIIKTYPNTEASFRAEPLLVSVGEVIEKTPVVKLPSKTTKMDFENQALNQDKAIAKNLIVGQWDLTTSTKINSESALAPHIDKYEFKANGEVLLVDTINQLKMLGSYKIIDKNTVTYSFANPKNKQKQIVETLNFYISQYAGFNKLELIYKQHVFTYLPSNVFKNNSIVGTWKGELLTSKGKSTSYELVLGENGLSDGFSDGKRSHYGYFRYWSNPFTGDVLHLSNQIPSYGNFGIRSYSVKVHNGVMLVDPIPNKPNQKTYTFKLTKVDDNDSAEKLWWNKKVSSASNLTSIELKQRKLVSRFYQVLEIMPDGCPKSVRKEFLKSVDRFMNEFPEFNTLIKKSKFRLYAIEKFSESMQLKEKACLYYKSAIDMHIDTARGRKDMNKNLEIMHSGN